MKTTAALSISSLLFLLSRKPVPVNGVSLFDFFMTETAETEGATILSTPGPKVGANSNDVLGSRYRNGLRSLKHKKHKHHGKGKKDKKHYGKGKKDKKDKKSNDRFPDKEALRFLKYASDNKCIGFNEDEYALNVDCADAPLFKFDPKTGQVKVYSYRCEDYHDRHRHHHHHRCMPDHYDECLDVETSKPEHWVYKAACDEHRHEQVWEPIPVPYTHDYALYHLESEKNLANNEDHWVTVETLEHDWFDVTSTQRLTRFPPPQCSAYSQCAHLSGDCCPTHDGVYLDCCKTSETLASCSAYSACNHLGLTGECCPSSEGVYLDCCFE